MVLGDISTCMLDDQARRTSGLKVAGMGREDLLAETIHRVRLAPVGDTALLIEFQ